MSNSTRSEAAPKIHYCWKILFACCMMQGSAIGIITNCVGLFYLPISKDLGFSIGAITLYVTLQNLSSCAWMLLVNQIFHRFGFRRVMIWASLLTAIPSILMGFTYELWQWYVLGIIQGVGMAFTTLLVVPLVLRKWFHQKLGFAMGVSSSFAGFGGAVMSALLGVVINTFSWRTAYITSGIVSLAMMLPVSIFILAMEPAEKDCLPYGYDRTSPAPATKASVGRQRVDIYMIAIILLAILSKSHCAFVSHLPTYGNTIHITIVDASLLTTFCMLGNVTSKLAFGEVNDKLGVKCSAYIALAFVGGAILALMTGNQIMACFAVFFFGVVSMFSLTEMPLIAKTVWSEERYASVVTAISVAANLSSSIFVSVYGFLYDLWGQYDRIFYLMLAVLASEVLIVHYLLHPKHSVL